MGGMYMRIREIIKAASLDELIKCNAECFKIFGAAIDTGDECGRPLDEYYNKTIKAIDNTPWTETPFVSLEMKKDCAKYGPAYCYQYFNIADGSMIDDETYWNNATEYYNTEISDESINTYGLNECAYELLDLDFTF